MDDTKPDVNVTPLIDVLLVLLVMLILTVPVATHQTTLNLPGGKTDVAPKIIRLAIDFDGRMFWNDREIANEDELSRYLHSAASAPEAPIVLVDPAPRARYEPVAQVLAAAQRAQVDRLAVRGIAAD
jgi:biopolymer transport protein ExbD